MSVTENITVQLRWWVRPLLLNARGLYFLGIIGPGAVRPLANFVARYGFRWVR